VRPGDSDANKDEAAGIPESFIRQPVATALVMLLGKLPIASEFAPDTHRAYSLRKLCAQMRRSGILVQ
jgi:hypothetical protein